MNLINSQMPLLAKLHNLGSLAPLAATLDPHGEIAGEAVTATDGAADNLSVDEVIEHFDRKFTAGIAGGTIRAAAIFFHGFVDAERRTHVAHAADEAQAVIIRLFHAEQPGSAETAIPYR